MGFTNILKVPGNTFALVRARNGSPSSLVEITSHTHIILSKQFKHFIVKTNRFLKGSSVIFFLGFESIFYIFVYLLVSLLPSFVFDLNSNSQTTVFFFTPIN